MTISAVAMSGGMDSTATALLLKSRGHRVIGLHMILHEGSDRTLALAEAAARHVGIDLEAVDLREPFSRLIIAPFLHEYASGRTPSPCPRCNRLVKVAYLLERARALGCSFLATGHYARIDAPAEGPQLVTGVDPKKDQSYFLSWIPREMLSRLVCPLGAHTKAWTREFLKQAGIAVWTQEESQELCFVPGNDYRGFLRGHGIEARPGPIVDVEGRQRGRHRGIWHYTVGQRRGLGIPDREPLYVVRIEQQTNTVIVGGRHHLLARAAVLDEVNILRSRPPAIGERLTVKVRSTAPAMGCSIVSSESGRLALEFHTPQAGVAPGQIAVLYDGCRVVASGWIERADGCSVPDRCTGPAP